MTPDTPDRDLDEWDAEIDAEFQRVVRGAKAAGLRKRGRRHVGVPVDFLADVCRLTRGRSTVLVALCIYRRTCVCRSKTVTLPGADIAELGISRSLKNKALAKLEAAGLIRLEKGAGGQSARVTLTWQPN
jgi:hypothetical protein